ncbi:lysin [Escherichia phage M01]|nr:lysin [Escherichia phage M01]
MELRIVLRLNEKYLTIGYGHYGPDVTPGKTITPGQGLLLLNRDMAKAVAAVDAAAHHSLTQAQFDAVCDLVYNAGAGVIAVYYGHRQGTALRRYCNTACQAGAVHQPERQAVTRPASPYSRTSGAVRR